MKRTVDGLKNIGFKGVILCYAREIVLDEKEKQNLSSCGEGDALEASIQNEIVPWEKGTLETVRLTSPGKEHRGVNPLF